MRALKVPARLILVLSITLAVGGVVAFALLRPAVRSGVPSNYDAYQTALAASQRSCPTPTTVVSNTKELSRALKAVRAGQVIFLKPGRYVGKFRIDASGTPDKPIWLCGTRDSIITTGSVRDGAAIRITEQSNIALQGFRIDTALQGVMIMDSKQLLVDNLMVTNMGQEAIHVYDFSDNVVVSDNVITTTGSYRMQYGEGIYVGTSWARWDEVTQGRADRTSNTFVLNNELNDIGAEGIEVKEGARGGEVRGNNITGHRRGSTANAWIMVRGNDFLIKDNRGARAVEHGVLVMRYEDWSGLRNRIEGTTGDTSAPGWGVYIPPTAPTQLYIACNNTARGAKGTTSMLCDRGKPTF